MFKKKAKLPARPKPPTFEEIQEDIAEAPEDDVAFTYHPMSPTAMNDETGRLLQNESKMDYENDSNSDSDNLDSDPDILFNKVKTFVEINNSLKTSSNCINDHYELLIKKGQGLQNDAEKVKKRIADVLKWQGADTNAFLVEKME